MAEQDTDVITADLVPMAASDAASLPRGTPRSRALDLVRTARFQPDSFRRSEAYVAGQIARAVARGQRVL